MGCVGSKYKSYKVRCLIRSFNVELAREYRDSGLANVDRQTGNYEMYRSCELGAIEALKQADRIPDCKPQDDKMRSFVCWLHKELHEELCMRRLPKVLADAIGLGQ